MEDRTSPLYDLFEGLGRRRRLRRLSIDPDQLVSVPMDLPIQKEEKPQEEAAA